MVSQGRLLVYLLRDLTPSIASSSSFLFTSSLPDWIKKSPYHLKVNAINEAHAAFKASRQRGTKQQEAGKFRSIRDRVQSIKFRVEDFKKGTWLPMLTKGLNFQTSELIPSYNVEYLP